MQDFIYMKWDNNCDYRYNNFGMDINANNKCSHSSHESIHKLIILQFYP